MTAAILEILLFSVIISPHYQNSRLIDWTASSACNKPHNIIKVRPSILKTNQLLICVRCLQKTKWHMMPSRQFLPSRFRAPMWGWGFLNQEDHVFRLIVTIFHILHWGPQFRPDCRIRLRLVTFATWRLKTWKKAVTIMPHNVRIIHSHTYGFLDWLFWGS